MTVAKKSVLLYYKGIPDTWQKKSFDATDKKLLTNNQLRLLPSAWKPNSLPPPPHPPTPQKNIVRASINIQMLNHQSNVHLTG